MGVHTLVTGLNGAGKTLYTVAEVLLPMSKQTVEYKGKQIPRRLVVGGISDLLIEHELMEVPEIDPETFTDEWGTVVRERGQPPVEFVRRSNGKASGYVACDQDDDGAEPILCTALNWWAWVRPGDLIVIDECQRLFRPMASGRRVPKFISRLETARHYGAEFVYITQHAGLIHANVRGLVGPHRDVRRVFGGVRTVIYEWDKINVSGNITKSVARVWKHNKAAFGLYKSAELHTKFGQRLPVAVYALGVALLALGYLAWTLKGRFETRFAPPQSAVTANADTPASTGTASPGAAPQAHASTSPTWPWYEAEPVKQDREPLAGRAIQMEGGYTQMGQPHYLFGVVIEGERVATLNVEQLASMGYYYTEYAPCVGVLRFGERERLVTCPPAQAAANNAPSRQADAPSASQTSGPANALL